MMEHQKRIDSDNNNDIDFVDLAGLLMGYLEKLLLIIVRVEKQDG